MLQNRSVADVAREREPLVAVVGDFLTDIAGPFEASEIGHVGAIFAWDVSAWPWASASPRPLHGLVPPALPVPVRLLRPYYNQCREVVQERQDPIGMLFQGNYNVCLDRRTAGSVNREQIGKAADHETKVG